MTFDEVLDEVRALLRQHGRVTYRSLKRRFELDDEYLEDLKGELIRASPGSAYVTDYTARPVSGFFRLRDLGRFEVRGLREPLVSSSSREPARCARLWKPRALGDCLASSDA